MKTISWNFGPMEEVKPKFKCKHKKLDCLECGTYQRTDQAHTTRNGKGKVAQLLAKKKR